jgi:hypothetical protein
LGFEIVQVGWRRDGTRSIAVLSGEIDISARPVFAGLTEVARTEPFEVDLSGVGFIDVAGMRLVSRLAEMPNVTIRSPSPVVTRLAGRLGVRCLG